MVVAVPAPRKEAARAALVLQKVLRLASASHDPCARPTAVVELSHKTEEAGMPPHMTPGPEEWRQFPMKQGCCRTCCTCCTCYSRKVLGLAAVGLVLVACVLVVVALLHGDHHHPKPLALPPLPAAQHDALRAFTVRLGARGHFSQACWWHGVCVYDAAPPHYALLGATLMR